MMPGGFDCAEENIFEHKSLVKHPYAYQILTIRSGFLITLVPNEVELGD